MREGDRQWQTQWQLCVTGTHGTVVYVMPACPRFPPCCTATCQRHKHPATTGLGVQLLALSPIADDLFSNKVTGTTWLEHDEADGGLGLWGLGTRTRRTTPQRRSLLHQLMASRSMSLDEVSCWHVLLACLCSPAFFVVVCCLMIVCSGDV